MAKPGFSLSKALENPSEDTPAWLTAFKEKKKALPTMYANETKGQPIPLWKKKEAEVVYTTAVQALNELIATFYDSLNIPSSKEVQANIEGISTPAWKSFSGEAIFKGRDQFIDQVKGFGKGIPDLTWKIQEVVVSANKDKVIVRSIASGTPTPNLMGVPNPENRKFSIYAIDIHTIKDGKLVTAHHVEDWATAFKQIKGEYIDLPAPAPLSCSPYIYKGEELQARAERLVAKFYDSLTNPYLKRVSDNVLSSAAGGWLSFSGETNYKNREAFIGQVNGFGKLIPNLVWDVKEIIPSFDGTKVVVRSEVSGTPEGPLFGKANTGKITFSIMAIDIHTISDDQLIRTDHAEDWKTALAQLG